ncbi:MAG: GNAT family N-acetyltransferase [Dehalococcoidia bacterium]|jgi:GNAT superfamily N-acetyltransferase|nr:GNAT family N-acetyltransferase [Dehalococcoidia bacterium]
MATITVRAATESDAADIVRFIRALAEYERAAPAVVNVTEQDVVRDGFGANARFETLIAEVDGAPAGFALFFPTYSTWEGRTGVHIEDLFVEERVRMLGVGRRLMAAVAGIAAQRGWARLDLAVLDWNPARAFYHRLGMTQMEEWLPYRMEPEDVRALAAEAAESAEAPRRE